MSDQTIRYTEYLQMQICFKWIISKQDRWHFQDLHVLLLILLNHVLDLACVYLLVSMFLQNESKIWNPLSLVSSGDM